MMNMNPSYKQVWLTMYYDYVDEIPRDFEEVKPVWLDAAQCGTSERSGGSAGSSFSIGSLPWIANFEGDILGVGGHLRELSTSLQQISVLWHLGKVSSRTRQLYQMS
jgi:hypothetical protein